MIGLVLTNDWELFGDGSGNFDEVQYEPTLDLINILSQNNAVMTFFTEIGQQLTYKESGKEKYEQIAGKWEDAVKKAAEKGNDFQLHFHPQWIQAKFEDNEWKLPDDKWTMKSQEVDDLKQWISKGKSYIESLVSVNNYECKVYRAGAYYIEPSSRHIPLLKELGFEADTSITKGMYVSDKFDYRKAYSNKLPYRTDKSTLLKKGNDGLIEIPIYSKYEIDSEAFRKFVPNLYFKLKFGVSPKQKELEWISQRDKVKLKRYPIERRAYKKAENRNLSWYAKKILSKSPLQLDYDYIPASIFVKIVSDLTNDKSVKKYTEKGVTFPIVASGHIKDAHTNDNLKWILEEINSKHSDKIKFITMSEALENAKKIVNS